LEVKLLAVESVVSAFLSCRISWCITGPLKRKKTAGNYTNPAVQPLCVAPSRLAPSGFPQC
jgi:hypothetical protein